ncbi:MAG: penicillin-binding protein 2 [Bacteroidetes bacterium]|nr:penicillin-binding protein 2 [Bacteroidota bacterium]
MKAPYSDRKYVIYIIFISIGIILGFRLIYLQLMDSSYKVSADKNVLRYNTEFPARGLIYDRNGKLLVYNEAAYDLMVIPKYAKNIDTLGLCQLLGIDKATFIEKMKKASIYSSYSESIFEKQISKEVYGFIQEKLYKFPGFFVQARTLRKYPIPIAAHTLGYIGEVSPEKTLEDKYYKPGDYIGISGIEKSYEAELRGKKGLKVMMVDVFNREKGNFAGGKFDSASIAGKDLYTSLDADLQTYGEYLMKNKRGSIVAIEPETGEILTLVSSPTYNPNLLTGRIRSKNYMTLIEDKLKPLFNRALMAQYPPGSTFKLVNALIGEQEKVLVSSTRFPCSLGFHFGKLTVKCHAHGSPLDLEQSIVQSCNAYYCYAFKAIVEKRPFISTKAGFNKWRNHVLSFGLGEKFHNDLPNELSGNIPTSDYYDKYHGKNRWRAVSVISLSIGQGEIGITPLQLANLAAIIANRGWYYIPHIVKAIGKKNNLNQRFIIKKNTTVEAQYFEPVVNAMNKVVQSASGTGFGGKLENVSMCGKTGTAQNPHGKNHSLFIAFAPKDNPKIAISVIVENAGYGSEWAVPIASLMIEKYLFGKVKRKDLEQKMITGNLISSN